MFFGLVIGICAAIFVDFAREFLLAPLGWEDSEGFHPGLPFRGGI